MRKTDTKTIPRKVSVFRVVFLVYPLKKTTFAANLGNEEDKSTAHHQQI